MGNLWSYPNKLISYYSKSEYDPHRNLLPLTEDQRAALLELKERAENQFYLYGDNDQDEKPCKRLKIGPAWTKAQLENHITQYPRWLKMYHIIYMLEHNVQLET